MNKNDFLQSDKKSLIDEILQELLKIRLEEYEQFKAMSLSISADRKGLVQLFKVIFAYVEARQPKLIEMKE